MGNVPIKFAGGVDANNKPIIGVATPSQVDLYHAVNVDYLEKMGIAGDSETMYVNVVNVKSGKEDLPVVLVKKNGVYVEKASTASDDISIVIRFGKKFSSRTLPNVEYIKSNVEISDIGDSGHTWTSLFTQQEIDDFDFSYTGETTFTSGKIKTLELDYVQTFEFELTSGVSTSNFYYFKNGVNIYGVELIGFDKPEITSAEITSGYAVGQSELADGKSYSVEITSDSNIYEVEIMGDYLVDESQTKLGSNYIETISTTVTNGPTNTDSAVNGYFKVRVKDENGTWSNWYNSENDSSTNVDGDDYMSINNTAPSFGNHTITYSNDPYTALNLYTEDGSEATILFASVNNLGDGGGVSGAPTGGSGLNIFKTNNEEFVVHAGIATYKYNTETATFTATRVRNGRTTTENVEVNIASEDMDIGNISQNTFRSSPTGEVTPFNLTGTNQRIRAGTLNLNQNISGLTLENQGTISGVNINNASMKITDASVKGEYIDLLEVKLEGLSGREVTKNFTIISKGFVKRMMVGQDIQEPVEIPTVTDEEKLYVGIGDETTTGNGAKVELYVHGGGIVSPQFSGADAGEAEFAVYYDNVEEKWFIVFDDNVFSEASSGVWLDNATIIIEEEI